MCKHGTIIQTLVPKLEFFFPSNIPVLLLLCSLSGMSPFLGETDKQTFCNIVKAHYDIDEDFGETEVSSEAKDFIESLLVKDPRLLHMPYWSSVTLCKTAV